MENSPNQNLAPTAWLQPVAPSELQEPFETDEVLEVGAQTFLRLADGAQLKRRDVGLGPETHGNSVREQLGACYPFWSWSHLGVQPPDSTRSEAFSK